MDGEGVLEFPEGHKIKGIFQQGGIVSEVQLTYPNDDFY